jgi:iron complex outermembrane recepter protein
MQLEGEMLKRGEILSPCARAVAAAALCLTTRAMAQDATPATSPASSDQGAQLEEITVTAQRRAESAQSVPIAIEAVSGDKLEQMEITDTTQLSAFVPGLNISRANVGAVPFLRGIGNVSATPGNEAAVGTYIDEVYHPAAGGSNYAFNDIAQIEVLKGPQGTLFGRNAAGGVISVTTRDPTQTPEANVEVGYANYNTWSASMYGSTPVTDKLAADISLYGYDQGTPWGHNLFDGTEAYLNTDLAARSKWVYRPDDDTKVTFIANIEHVRNDTASAAALIPGFTSLGGYQHVGGFYDINSNFDPYGETDNYDFTLKAQHDFTWATVKSITAFLSSHWTGIIENDASPANIQEAQLNSQDKTTTQEFQIASPGSSKIVWIGGLYLFIDDSSEYPFRQYGTVAAKYPGDTLETYTNQYTQSYAAYGQATTPLFRDDTHLTLGLRYTDDNRHFIGHQSTIEGTIFNPGDQTESNGAVTYRFALDHQFTDSILGYVSYNRGFKSGNFNANSPTVAPTKPEFLNAYELGLKSDLLGERLRINASTYLYNFQDLQVQQQLITGTLQTNAAAAKYYGVDLDVTAVVTSAFSIQASMNAEDAYYVSFPDATFNYPAANGLGMVSHPADAEGYDIPYAERFSASLNAVYKFSTAWSAVLTGAYHDGFHFDTQGLVAQPSYWIANGSVTWTAPSGNLRVKLWGDNLFKAEYFAQKQVSAPGLTYSPAPPQTYGVKVFYQL